MADITNPNHHAGIDANAGLDMFFQFPPPNPIGDAYTSIVTDAKGETIGSKDGKKTLAEKLGYSDTDNIGSALDEIVSLASQLNISLLSPQSAEQAMVNFLNTIDPTQPSFPPVKALIMIAERALQQGKLTGTALNATALEQNASTGDVAELIRDAKNDSDSKGDNQDGSVDTTAQADDEDSSTSDPGSGFAANNLNADIVKQTIISDGIKDDIATGRVNVSREKLDTQVSIGKTSGGNPWLAGNVYVAFLIIFNFIQRILMENKVVQGKVELAGMNLVTTLAQSTADAIMSIAKTQQMIHIVTAVMSGIAVATAICGLGYSAFGTRVGAIDIGTGIGGLGALFEKLATAATQAGTDLTIAEQEGLKEILRSYNQIAQNQMNKAGDAFKSNDDQIVQLLQTLDKIRDGLQQALAASMRK